MKAAFKQNQRVIANTNATARLHGKAGQVHRITMEGHGREAWIRMDEELPFDLQTFGAEDARHNDILLYSEECDPESTVTP